MYKLLVLLIFVNLAIFCRFTNGHNQIYWNYGQQRQNYFQLPRWEPKPTQGYNQGWGYGGYGGNGIGYWNHNVPPLNFPTQTVVAIPPVGTIQPVKTPELIKACIRSCPVTSEYNPVCGTNGVTYINLGRLECVKSCGVEVQLSRQTACTDLPLNTIENINNLNEGINRNGVRKDSNINNQGTSNLSGGISTDEGNNGLHVNNFTAIKNISTITGNSGTKVSDTNTTNSGIGESHTYDNYKADKETRIQGQKNWNSSTEYSDNNKLDGAAGTIGNSNIAKIGNTGNLKNDCSSGKTPSLNEVMACLQLCPLTLECNPVCGNDGITYTNPGRLLCSQFCGIDVKIRKFAPCTSSAINYFECPAFTHSPVTNNQDQITPPMPSVQICMETCPVTSEYKPVCGSNNITYQNIGRLQCARNCGIDVFLQKDSECEIRSEVTTTTSPTPPTGRPIWANTERPTLPPLPLSGVTEPSIVNCMIRCTPSHENSPVCGTDNNTYVNIASFNCAKRCGVEVDVKSLTACPGFTQPTTNPPKAGYIPGRLTTQSDVISNNLPEDHPALTVSPNESLELEIDQRR